MKSKGYIIICRLLATLIVTTSLAACHTVQHETAMEWMQRQPMTTDP